MVAGPEFSLTPDETKRWFGSIKSVAKTGPMRDTFRGVMPFHGSEITRVALLLLFPGSARDLPRLLQ